MEGKNQNLQFLELPLGAGSKSGSVYIDFHGKMQLKRILKNVLQRLQIGTKIVLASVDSFFIPKHSIMLLLRGFFFFNSSFI